MNLINSIDSELLVEELRTNIRSIKSKNKWSTKFWVQTEKRLKKFILTEDPKNFIRWKIIRDTMFFIPPNEEYEYIKKSGYWDKINQLLLFEDKVGNPDRYIYDHNSSGNLVHHFYSIVQFCLNDFKTLAGKKLNLEIRFKDPYKITDFKPAFGYLEPGRVDIVGE